MNGRSGRTAGIGILVGAALVIVSAFLVWFTFEIQGLGEQEVKGIGNADDGGSLVMALGAVGLAAIAAVLGLILAIRGRGRGLAIASLVVSLFLLIVGGYASFAPEAAIVQFEAQEFGEGLGISESEAKQVLEEAFESGQLGATAGVGAYVALGGAVVAVLASIMGIAAGGKKPEAAYAPPPPQGGFPAAPPPPSPSPPQYPPPTPPGGQPPQ